MAKTGLLILTNPSTISRILPVVKEHVQQTLYVQLSPQRRLIPPWISNGEPALKPPHFRKVVVGIYAQASSLCQNLDVRVLLSGIKSPFQKNIDTKKKIDVVIFDKKYSNDEVNDFMQSCLPNKNSSCQVVTLKETSDLETDVKLLKKDVDTSDSSQSQMVDPGMYENVVLGGTFDRLHPGHKILLTEALLHCSKKLLVGVTDLQMLKSKKLWELIEPCEKRMNDVHDFLCDVDNSVEYDIVPISDPFGPTKEDPNLNLIVVSSETARGGQKVNEIRQQNGLPVLDVLNIELLETLPEEYELEEAKVSSSNYRLRLLGSRLKEPEPKPHIPSRPYIIGLTGCIASGKTAIGKRLEGLGAGVINCDIVAHNLYKKGEMCYSTIVEHFGSRILDSQGEVDRKILGSILFGDKEQLSKLNNILWPSILQRAKEEAQTLYEKGHEIVVLEAAVLLQAGWAEHCHETWVSIIPPEEAVKRIQSRNNLSIKDAEARVLAQPSNVEMVSHAIVVFCSLWEPEYTQKQVEKAWRNLQSYRSS